ncbi:MAG: peptide chain release factor N(5)-glutamine methyltransferase [Gemmatimonadetes bacterium]|nr:peptide chain release factor N(5)-glutamine methyltransferase [Gemmatimonadota bacterium]MCH8144460.1 peptide chain release factor N(5)-glutamine methyltransferase [Gemmatimonadota bacterium]
MKSATGSDPNTPTLNEVLGWAVSRLQRDAVGDPRREAVGLWARVTETDPAMPLTAADRQVQEDQWERFRAAVERRAAGEPAQYATGFAGFRTLELRVDRRVLIPRPETEGLVQRVLDWAEAEGRWGAVVDIGAGSGCIALSLALEGSFSRVIATDVSEGALAVAADNAARINPDTPLELRLGEFFDPLEGTTFDAVVSNPPYVSAEEFDRLEAGVRLHEPRGALVSGERGMRHTRLLLESAIGHLEPGGLLAIEIDSQRADIALSLAVRCGWGAARIENDVFGRPRYLLANASERQR